MPCWLDAAEASRRRGDAGPGRPSRRVVHRHRRRHRSAAQRAGLLARDAGGGRRARANGPRSPACAPSRRRAAGSASPASRRSAGTIDTERVLLTGGPSLRSVGRLAGLRIPAGAARHTVCVLEPHPGLRRRADADGLRHRRGPVLAARGGRPAVRLQRPGRDARRGAPDRLGVPRADARAARRARAADQGTSACARSGSRPSTTRRTTCRSWARRSLPDGSAIEGVTVASPGGHGMMWGPGVARVAADLALRGTDGPDRRDGPGPRPLRCERASAAWRRTRSRCRSRWSRTTTRSRSRVADGSRAPVSSSRTRRSSRSRPARAGRSCTGFGRSTGTDVRCRPAGRLRRLDDRAVQAVADGVGRRDRDRRSGRRPRGRRGTRANDSAPAMQPTKLPWAARSSGVSASSATTSLMPIRPPGRRTRAISARTVALSADRLMTQLLMTTSTLASPSGMDSMRPLRNSTFVAPASAALRRASSSISSVMSRP